MERARVVVPDTVPAAWQGSCRCEHPVPESRAQWKGAARTHCARCGLPVRIDFARR
jgi:hypothetical protein